MGSERRVGLVGCVKSKAQSARPAHDLYLSPLFTGRRKYVEASCSEWWVLSALHGLVHTDEVLEPYDMTLSTVGIATCREWSRRVLASVDERVRLRAGDVVEIHAGSRYRDYGVVEGLVKRGVEVVIPTFGMPLGQQLAFYHQEAAG